MKRGKQKQETGHIWAGEQTIVSMLKTTRTGPNFLHYVKKNLEINLIACE